MARSPQLARLFSYICQRYFEGLGATLNELHIAVNVFGRSADFDCTQDAIARVEAHRLRKKSKEYYENEGRDHRVQIILPPGSYVPVFHHVFQDAAAPGIQNPPPVSFAEGPLHSGAHVPEVPAETPPPQLFHSKRRPWAFPLSLLVTGTLQASSFSPGFTPSAATGKRLT